MPGPQVRPLVGQDGGQLGLVEQVKRARADHDRRAQPRHAVRGGGRMIDDERARDLGVVVREQPEQRPLPVPGPQHGGHRGDQDPAEQGQQQDPGGQRQDAQRR